MSTQQGVKGGMVERETERVKSILRCQGQQSLLYQTSSRQEQAAQEQVISVSSLLDLLVSGAFQSLLSQTSWGQEQGAQEQGTSVNPILDLLGSRVGCSGVGYFSQFSTRPRQARCRVLRSKVPQSIFIQTSSGQVYAAHEQGISVTSLLDLFGPGVCCS